jgi:hypothetical protein
MAIPSQRDALYSAKRDAVNAYTSAQRTKDKEKFLEATTRLQELAQKVIEANNSAVSSIKSGYPVDVKSPQARQTYDRKMSDIRKSLSDANQRISSFAPPSEMTPESIRAVDAFVSAIDKAIDAHQAGCLNIR